MSSLYSLKQSSVITSFKTISFKETEKQYFYLLTIYSEVHMEFRINLFWTELHLNLSHSVIVCAHVTFESFKQLFYLYAVSGFFNHDSEYHRPVMSAVAMLMTCSRVIFGCHCIIV